MRPKAPGRTFWETVMSAANLVAVMVTLSLTSLCTANTVRMSFWRTIPQNPYRNASSSAAMMVTSSRSRLDCAVACALRTAAEPCVAMMYGAGGRGPCVLLSQLVVGEQSSGDVQQGLELFVNEANLCCAEDVVWHANNRTVDVIKEHSPTSLEAELLCDEDYMSSGDDVPTAICRDGEWSLHNGTCRQRIWRNETAKVEVNYRVPHTPQPGWSLCLHGNFDGDERWVVNLRANEEDILFNLMTCYQYKRYSNMSFLNHRVDGVNGRVGDDRLTVSPPDFPFLPHQDFDVTIIANTSSEVHVFVDDEFYTNYTLPLPLSSLTYVSFRYQVRVLYLDLWCFP